MSLAIWLEASRPKTLVASLAPVILAALIVPSPLNLPIFIATLIAAVAVQVGTNLANDYFDFLKGADTPFRKGPRRVTQAGLVSPTQMKWAISLTLTTAFAAAIPLILKGGLPIALLTLTSLALSIGYTAGPFPLAYLGLGDFFVFLFFGPIATAATYYLQTDTCPWIAWAYGVAPGCLSSAILVVNNLRDIEEDTAAHKKTTVVRFGKHFGRLQYLLNILTAAVFPLLWGHRLPLLLLVPGSFLIFHLYSSRVQYHPLLIQTALLLPLYVALSL